MKKTGKIGKKALWIVLAVLVVSALVIAYVFQSGSFLSGFTRLPAYNSSLVLCMSEGETVEGCGVRQGIVSKDITLLDTKYTECQKTYAKDYQKSLECLDQIVVTYTPTIESNIKIAAADKWNREVLSGLEKSKVYKLELIGYDGKKTVLNDIVSVVAKSTSLDLKNVSNETVDLSVTDSSGVTVILMAISGVVYIEPQSEIKEVVAPTTVAGGEYFTVTFTTLPPDMNVGIRIYKDPGFVALTAIEGGTDASAIVNNIPKVYDEYGFNMTKFMWKTPTSSDVSDYLFVLRDLDQDIIRYFGGFTVAGQTMLDIYNELLATKSNAVTLRESAAEENRILEEQIYSITTTWVPSNFLLQKAYWGGLATSYRLQIEAIDSMIGVCTADNFSSVCASKVTSTANSVQTLQNEINAMKADWAGGIPGMLTAYEYCTGYPEYNPEYSGYDYSGVSDADCLFWW